MGMMGDGGTKPEKLFGVKVNSSELGHPLTWAMGVAKVNQLLFWVDGFAARKQSGGSSGGGGGGKKGGGYLYSANVIAGLCSGPIMGIGDMWTSTSMLGNPRAAELVVIGGTYRFTPTNAASLINDYGVTPASTYTGSFTDYSAPGTTTVANTTSIPFTRLAYGSTLTTGTYSVNPSTGEYNFSSADVGTTVTVGYSFLLTVVDQQETDLVPYSQTISIAPTFAFKADLGVVYGGTGPDTGTAFTRVSISPTVAGTYRVTGSAPAVYHFAAGDVGAEVVITYQTMTTESDPALTHLMGQDAGTMLDFTLAEGYIGQSPYSFLSASYPGAAIGYSGAATVLYDPMDMGMSGTVAQNSFEVVTHDFYSGVYSDGGGWILDCNPCQCMYKVLTDKVQGLGIGPLPFPPEFIDNAAGGTWGMPGTPSVQSEGPTAWNWFAANNFFISPVIDSQDSAASVMSKWLEAGMCAAFVSEGLLKLVPYGDTTTAANGCTWTAPSIYVVALDDTNFLAKDGEDPVKIKRTPWADAFNDVQVSWDNRNNQYAKEITEESDQSLINRYGCRKEDPQDYNFIHTLQAATFSANMRLKHGTYIRNTYEFTLPFIYSYLEPMDLVTLTTSSVWAQGVNNTNLGVVDLPVRLTKVVDDPVEGIKCEAEDYPFGAGCATLFNKGQSAGEVISNAYASPGTSEVILFEAYGRLVGYQGNQIWIGACGTGKNYGATNVWVSQDDITYIQVATLTQPAAIGEVIATFGATADPDTTNSLVVELVDNSAPLASGTTLAADNDTMLCYVGGEVISYSACTLTGQNAYNMGTYIRRGQFNTPITSHAPGSLFMRLDMSIFKYTYDPVWQGKTVYFKFQAVNNFGNNPQPLSNLTAVAFTIRDTNSGAVDASTGLVLTGTPMVYQIAPLFDLTQPTPTTIVMGACTADFNGTTVNYATRTFTISLGSPAADTWFYVCINDPDISGETTATLTASCIAADTYVGQLGWTFIGAILATSTGGPTDFLIAGGWPNPLTIITSQPSSHFPRPLPGPIHHHGPAT